MPHPNAFELESCLDDLVAFVDANPRSPYAEDLGARVRAAQAAYEDAQRTSDALYARWRRDEAELTQAHKKLRQRNTHLQAQFAELGAHDYPTDDVAYLDQESTRAQTRAMIAYLTTHQEVHAFAEEAIAELSALLEAVGDNNAAQSLARWQSGALQRRRATASVARLIRQAHRQLHDDLDPEAQASIRWPMATTGLT